MPSALTALAPAAALAQPALPREPNGGAGAPSISADGARIAFDSDATNLVRADSNNETTDPFIRDLVSNATFIADRTPRRKHADRGGRYRRSPGYAISANGQYVVFSSNSRDLGRGGGGQLRDLAPQPDDGRGRSRDSRRCRRRLGEPRHLGRRPGGGVRVARHEPRG